MTTDEEMRDKIQQAIKTAETFSTIYYKKMDSERHNMDKLYLDTATLAWNGNPVDVRWTKENNILCTGEITLMLS